MCLNSIEQVLEPTMEEVEGWKVFSVFKDGTLIGDFHTCNAVVKEKGYPIGEWILDTNWKNIHMTIPSGGDAILEYNPGFHFFYKYEDALNWASDREQIRKVKMRGVHTIGYQDCLYTWKAGVAREMYIFPPAVLTEVAEMDAGDGKGD